MQHEAFWPFLLEILIYTHNTSKNIGNQIGPKHLHLSNGLRTWHFQFVFIHALIPKTNRQKMNGPTFYVNTQNL